MKLSAFWKGLIMAVVGFIATTISTGGEGLNFTYIFFATIGFTLVYVGKNAIFASTSGSGIVNWQDLISGLVIALGMAVSSGLTTFIINGAIDWHALWVAVVAAIVGYFTKTIPSQPKAKAATG